MGVIALGKKNQNKTKKNNQPTQPFKTIATKATIQATKIYKKIPPALTNYKLLKVVKRQEQIYKAMYKQMQKQDQNLGK